MTKQPDLKVPIDEQVGNRARLPTTIKRVLVPTDLTNESQSAIEFGLLLAQRFGAGLTLLHVYQRPYAIEYLRGPDTSEEVWKRRIYFVDTLKFFANNVKVRYADCDTEFREGELCEEIVNTAKDREVDLIILSTHHYNWLTRLAYGCDAETILRHAPCPIVVLPVNGDTTTIWR
jgi:universal stress protein A